MEKSAATHRQHLTSVEAKKPLQHVKKKKTRNPRQHGQHKQSQEINSQTAMNHCGFMRGEMWDLLKRGNLLCVRKTKELLSIHGGPVEHCDISPIYICGGRNSQKWKQEDAKAKFDTCLDNSNDNKCTSFLNADAIKRSSGGAYTSPRRVI